MLGASEDSRAGSKEFQSRGGHACGLGRAHWVEREAGHQEHLAQGLLYLSVDVF